MELTLTIIKDILQRAAMVRHRFSLILLLTPPSLRDCCMLVVQTSLPSVSDKAESFSGIFNMVLKCLQVATPTAAVPVARASEHVRLLSLRVITALFAILPTNVSTHYYYTDHAILL